MLKQELQQKPKDDDDEKKVDKEEGEIEDGELIEEDQEAAKHEGQDEVPQRNRNNQQRESVVKMEYSSLAEMEKGKTLKDFLCNAFV